MIVSFRGEYAFLANPYRAEIMMPDGLAYPTDEHAFQAWKTMNMPLRRQIAGMANWRDAKAAGRSLDLRPDWEPVKKQVMLRVVLAKFTQHADLAARLCATGGQLLVEGNTWGDDYWGAIQGPGKLNPALTLFTAADGTQFQGRNYLGQILMAVRLILRED